MQSDLLEEKRLRLSRLTSRACFQQAMISSDGKSLLIKGADGQKTVRVEEVNIWAPEESCADLLRS